MKRTRKFYVGATIAAVIAVLAIAQYTLQTVARAQENGSANRAGIYEVDRMWPKPLPNNWVLGSTVGLAIDARDHVFVVHRGQATLDPKFASQMVFAPVARGGRAGAAPAAPARGDAAIGEEVASGAKPISDLCCTSAPPVLEFDPAGNLVNHWGGPGTGFEWPPSMHGITIDGKDNVWLAGNGGNTVLKFSKDGKFLLQIGKNGASKGNKDTANLSRPAEVEVDMAANEVYVADGYVNHRVVVFDATTGAFKRKWGGTGDARFTTVGCAEIAKDGTVYVCDRGNNRVQAFDKNGRLLKQGIVAQETKGTGSVWDIALSSDPQQRFLFVADGHDQKVFILRRDTLEVIGSFGDGGRYPGTFYSVGSIAVDSRGNVYTGETLEGKRVQKFVPKGASR
jgi:DNA-binding beta-propeller fold protein YncE